MVFKNIRTGNLLTVDNKDVINMMANQIDTYAPYNPAKAAEKPTEAAEDKPEDTEAEKPAKSTKGKTKQ